MASTKDESWEFFNPASPIQTLKLAVDQENLAALRRGSQPATHNSVIRTYAKATLRCNNTSYKNVGIHLKGAAGSFRDWNDKPGITINSDKFKKNQDFHGLDKFYLNNSVQDETYLNELLFGLLFQAEGLASPRVTHVFVELNGRKAGLYVLREGFDKTFLKRHFKDASGNLYDGGFLADIDANPPPQLDSGPGCDWKDLKALSGAARTADHAERLKKLEKLVDLDKFAALWAIEILGCDWDGYMRKANNYRIYQDPSTDKLTFLPHGKDQMFQNPQEPIGDGWGGLVARRLYETEAGRKLYHAKLRSMLAKHFKMDNWNRMVDEWGKRLKGPLNEFQKGAGDHYMETLKQYKIRIKERIDYLNREVPKLKP